MANAIAHIAVVEAARHGFYHAAFRGIRILAVRQALPCGVGVALQMNFNASHITCVVRFVIGSPGHDKCRHPVRRHVIVHSDTVIVEPIDYP